MSNIAILERDVSADPELLDKLFAKTFSVAELLRGAEDVGYEIGSFERAALKEPTRMADTETSVKFKLPDMADMGITELDIEEIERVAAGVMMSENQMMPASYVNINVNVVALAAVAVMVIVIVGVFVL